MKELPLLNQNILLGEVTFVVIGKNEAKILPRCFSSILKLTDNIIFVDDETSGILSTTKHYSKYINFNSSNNFKELWEWSVSNPEIFWSKFWDYSKIIGDKGKEIIRKDKIFNKTMTSFMIITLIILPISSPSEICIFTLSE